MSIARAFTAKLAKRDSPDAPQKHHNTKHSFSSGSIRNMISSPVGLISTTNMLSYNAPDITSLSPKSDASDSDHKSISSLSTPPSSPDTEKSPEPNHLSCFFVGPTLSSKTSPSDQKESSAPKIPSRAPSHTKDSHENLNHKKSTSKSSSLSHKSSEPVVGNRSSTSALRNSYQKFNNIRRQSSGTNDKDNHRSSSSSTTVVAPSQTRTRQSSVSREPQSETTSTMSRPSHFHGLPSKPNHRAPPVLPQPQVRSTSTSRSPSASPPQPQFQAPAQLNPNQNRVAYDSSHGYMPSPFSKELAQVSEMAETFSGGKVDFMDEEMKLMAQRGLYRFGAEEYIREIKGLWSVAFGGERNGSREVEYAGLGSEMGAVWI